MPPEALLNHEAGLKAADSREATMPLPRPERNDSKPAFSSSAICFSRSRLSSRADPSTSLIIVEQFFCLSGMACAAIKARAACAFRHRAPSRHRARCADAAGGAADALGERDEIFLGGTGLEQGAREQRHIGHQMCGHAPQIEAEIEIDHAIGRQFVGEEPRAGQRAALDRDRLVGAIEILETKGRILDKASGELVASCSALSLAVISTTSPRCLSFMAAAAASRRARSSSASRSASEMSAVSSTVCDACCRQAVPRSAARTCRLLRHAP